MRYNLKTSTLTPRYISQHQPCFKLMSLENRIQDSELLIDLSAEKMYRFNNPMTKKINFIIQCDYPILTSSLPGYMIHYLADIVEEYYSPEFLKKHTFCFWPVGTKALIIEVQDKCFIDNGDILEIVNERRQVLDFKCNIN